MIPHTAHRATQFTMHGTKNESLLMWIHELTQTAKGGGGGGDGAGDEWGMTSDRQLALLAGLATEMRTAAGWRAAWAMCTCTKPVAASCKARFFQGYAAKSTAKPLRP